MVRREAGSSVAVFPALHGVGSPGIDGHGLTVGYRQVFGGGPASRIPCTMLDKCLDSAELDVGVVPFPSLALSLRTARSTSTLTTALKKNPRPNLMRLIFTAV